MDLTQVALNETVFTTLLERETAAFRQRVPGSLGLRERARRSQPGGVPMSWMRELYHHPPLVVAHGQGSHFTDIDGNCYLDMNLADLSASLGFAPPAVVEAVQAQTERGTSFLLPTEDGIVASELLAACTGMPYWQFTGSASTANAEAIRVCRVATGRDRVLMFDGKYHGHIDEVLIGKGEGGEEAEFLGLPRDIAAHARVISFNNLSELREALSHGDVACLLAEPVMTNCNLIFPDPDYWSAAAALTRESGALLIIDEAHTFSFAYGGLKNAWNLPADIHVVGKGLGSGIAFGAHGVSERLARLIEAHAVVVGAEERRGLALGGTTYANALALAAARAALEHCLTPSAYARTERLGTRLGRGLEALFAKHHRKWCAPHIGGRAAWVLAPVPPRNAQESLCSIQPLFVDTRRVFMANRGIWEAIGSAGPAASFAHDDADIDQYLQVADEFLAAIA